MNIRVRGISYFIKRHQEKPALPELVLLHGFMGSGELFQELIDSLLSFSNPITIDLLGHGKTEGAELHYRFSSKEQVADLSKLIAEQISKPVFLYGYSMGARLALQLALHRLDLVQGLILESGTFGIEGETEQQARQALDASRADQIIGNFDGFLDDWATKPLFQSSASISELDKVSMIQKKQNNIWMANALLGFGTGTMPCVREELKNLVSPVQLIVGEQDSKFIRINQTMNKEIPDSTLSIVEGANHRVHSDQPEECAKIIKFFITNHNLL
ncbi:MAG: 2-succinyl-6-hydroxy-2,4-cyclohexadiene-1-carboxylate synthase [Balneolaceae bacterium]|nr:2-succinyl-6-hydroxy-2,4-cyclohexadiene-1-carboxylate synthase [Balneolaceae bacterium]MBO6547115.1 2-succinyl-6-hydroxy-2,4-cyclohexadiene-1-carboxylate synthase [Balneolaceae bacterium]MBO6647938.1 2-succinyl-6-hydroxy-2,4-cyclohexadiene-1-carboxylate synthase [Balneolaceae bacterium]